MSMPLVVIREKVEPFQSRKFPKFHRRKINTS